MTTMLAVWRERLFADPRSALVSVLLLALLAWAGWRLVDWGVLDAVAAPDYAACKALEHGGACWASWPRSGG